MKDKWEIMQEVAAQDDFIALPLETQALYFHLVAHAEPDGHISAPKAITRGIGAKTDSLNELFQTGYISDSELGVIITE